MHTTGSFLKTFITRVRFMSDEPADDAIYSDADLVNHFYGPCYQDVWARINMSSKGRVVLRHSLHIVQGQEYYDLPPTISRLMRISMMDSNGVIYNDVKPRGEFHPAGPGWSIQGNTLAVRPLPIASGTVGLWYVPSGTFSAHYATDGNMDPSDTDGTLVALSTGPALGQLDKRINGYAGQVLRVLGANLHQERVIESHSPSDGTITLRRPLDPIPDTAFTYEIAPFANESLITAVSLRAAMQILAMKSGSANQRQSLMQEYQAAIKSVCDDMNHLQARTGDHFDRMTEDNRDAQASMLGWGYGWGYSG